MAIQLPAQQIVQQAGALISFTPQPVTQSSLPYKLSKKIQSNSKEFLSQIPQDRLIKVQKPRKKTIIPTDSLPRHKRFRRKTEAPCQVRGAKANFCEDAKYKQEVSVANLRCKFPSDKPYCSDKHFPPGSTPLQITRAYSDYDFVTEETCGETILQTFGNEGIQNNNMCADMGYSTETCFEQPIEIPTTETTTKPTATTEATTTEATTTEATTKKTTIAKPSPQIFPRENNNFFKTGFIVLSTISSFLGITTLVLLVTSFVLCRSRYQRKKRTFAIEGIQEAQMTTSEAYGIHPARAHPVRAEESGIHQERKENNDYAEIHSRKSEDDYMEMNSVPTP